MSHKMNTGDHRTNFATEVPSKHLPPVPYQDLPEAKPFSKVLGPGAILLAAGIGTGEYILWPYISTQVGLVFVWAAVVGLLTQYFINMEFVRYTLATGETAITGFARLWPPLWILFTLMTVIIILWPGPMVSSVTMLTFIFGGVNVILLSIIALISIGLALTMSPVVYQFVEKFEFVMLAIIILFLAAAVILGTTVQAWADLATGFANFGRIPQAESLPFAVLLGALAFAGAGFGNLALGNWARDKGWGMGARIPNIVSPITGEESAVPSTGYMFPQDDANLRRWRDWWSVTNKEQFITFFVLGVVGIVVLSVLAYSTAFGQNLGQDLDFIRAEGEVLSNIVAPWFGVFFWIAGAAVLFSTAVANYDLGARIVADALKVNWLRDSSRWSESRIYALIIWLFVVFGITVLLLGVNQPLPLIVIQGALSGIAIFLYSVLLVVLNRKALPSAIKIRGIRLAVMGWAILFFGFFAVVTVLDQIRVLIAGG